MTYVFPKTLAPLREYLKKLGFEGDSIKTSRQAAFVAQQLIGTRIRFPPQGSDMVPTMLEIQKALDGGRTVVAKIPQQPATQGAEGGRSARLGKGKRQLPKAKKQKDYSRFTSELFADGVHIFCDGAAVPNPGAGGWGVVVYRDGVEIDSQFGGDAATTNNQMEMTGLLVAIEKAANLSSSPGTLTIWCDSQYCVEGVNTWMETWKSRGWNKRKLDSPKRDEGGIKNLELWQAIDHALLDARHTAHISIQWVKGHIGIAGNERADELAEMGRQEVSTNDHLVHEDLDDRYRQIMGAM